MLGLDWVPIATKPLVLRAPRDPDVPDTDLWTYSWDAHTARLTAQNSWRNSSFRDTLGLSHEQYSKINETGFDLRSLSINHNIVAVRKYSRFLVTITSL